MDNYLTKYLNIPAVKAAIHADPSINWIGCSSVVNYSYVCLFYYIILFIIKTYNILYKVLYNRKIYLILFIINYVLGGFVEQHVACLREIVDC